MELQIIVVTPQLSCRPKPTKAQKKPETVEYFSTGCETALTRPKSAFSNRDARHARGVLPGRSLETGNRIEMPVAAQD